MRMFDAMRIGACAVLVAGLAHTAAAAEILIANAQSQPESLAVAPGGVLIVGSASTPFVYKVRAGSTTAEKFVDASAEGAGTFFFGMLADGATNTLWTCQLTPVPGVTPVQRHTAVRSFDLTSGAPKIRWNLPGDNSTCNDFAIGPDKALYIADTANSKIYRLPAGASTAELFLEHRALYGIDGITFLNGTLYVNNVFSNNLYRIPVDGAGKPGQPVDIWMDQPVKGPDGMRAANGKLYLTENRNSRASMVTVNGDQATVVPIMEGLTRPTAIEPDGDTLWVGDRARDKTFAIPMPK